MNKHIKKYYFYLLGRFLDCCGHYDASAKAYAKVMKHRFFFADVQARFIKAYENTSGANLIMVRGGIGDMLQSLPFMLAHPATKYIVFTHFVNAEAFYSALGIKVEQFFFYSNLDEHKLINKKLFHSDDIYLCPRALFFDKLPFESKVRFFENQNPVVGFHFGASAIGTKKSLSIEFVRQVLMNVADLNLNALIFCTPDELVWFKKMGIHEGPGLAFSSEKDVTKSLSLVSHCDAFVGSDSAFKTMSAMLKIPTFVLFEDDRNRFRDRTFINPYISSGVMSVFKYNRLVNQEIDSAILIIVNFLKEKLSIG